MNTGRSLIQLYSFSTEQIKSRIVEDAPEIFEKVKSNHLDFRWNYFASPEDLLLKRRSAMDDFIVDFEKGKEQGRYISADVLKLPFDGSHSALTFYYFTELSFPLPFT